MPYVVFRKNPRNPQPTINVVPDLSRNDYEDSKYIKCSKDSEKHLDIINKYFEEKNSMTDEDITELLHIHNRIVELHTQGLERIWDHQVPLVMGSYNNMTYNYHYCAELLKLLCSN
jgi:hypothetical protein